MFNPSPHQLKKLQTLAKVLDNGDLALLTELDALESRLEGIEGQLPALREARDGDIGERGEQGDKGDRGEMGAVGIAGRDGKDSTTPGPQGPKGERGATGPAGRDTTITDALKAEIANLVELPDFSTVLLPTQVRDSLELIDEEEEKLKQSAIKNLPEDLERIRKSISKSVVMGGGLTRGGGGVTDGDKGDITVTATGATWTIDPNVVTNAKAAQMATKTYKGRTSALTGDAEDVAVATLKTDLVLVKADVGLGSVDDTSDASKPVSTAQATAINAKVASVSAGINVTITGTPTAPIVNAPTMTATVGGAVPTPPNVATQFLNGQGVFSTPAGGGGGGTVAGQATVNFGVITEENSIALVTVNTASALTASIIMVSPAGVVTALHDTSDYQWDNISGYVSNIVNGVSFDIIGVAPNGSFGTYVFNYVIQI